MPVGCDRYAILKMKDAYHLNSLTDRVNKIFMKQAFVTEFPVQPRCSDKFCCCLDGMAIIVPGE